MSKYGIKRIEDVLISLLLLIKSIYVIDKNKKQKFELKHGNIILNAVFKIVKKNRIPKITISQRIIWFETQKTFERIHKGLKIV